ncbi:MAG: flagellar hook assembly protein FlgD, partial [Krumholzibacteria bacterium]|nr:flagellar hook assembly protein FlgD [Candidatus Krumholzibacteria bacterium]MBE0567740.1 flagellar hook assembly protein FlgD [Candidatus Krumholzibacteria bacterium]
VGALPAGTHEVSWDGRDERGGRAASGIYLVRLTTADGGRQTMKVTLAK